MTISLPEAEILSTVPFRFVSVHQCDAIAAMPISFNFAREMLDCMEASFGIKAFDLFGIPAFSKRLAQESQTVLKTLDLASKKHRIKKVVLFQHVDFHSQGKSNRFSYQLEEDLHHKAGLLTACRKIIQAYPHIEVAMIYAKLINNQAEIEMSEIFLDSKERVRLVAPYRFKDIYSCDAAVVVCMDFRFRRESLACVRHSLDTQSFVLMGFPGASKEFLENSEAAWKAVKIACDRYGCKKIIAIHHADCGAYGGSGSFSDVKEEEVFHYQQMVALQEKIKKEYPQVAFIIVYARFVDNNTKIQFVRYQN